MRYGKIVILCDQDTDGSHIKGLCINLFHSEWRSLVQIKGFLSSKISLPILNRGRGVIIKLQCLFRLWSKVIEEITSCIFDSSLCLGTIFYGTIFHYNKNKYFCVQNVHSYKGNKVDHYYFQNKLTIWFFGLWQLEYLNTLILRKIVFDYYFWNMIIMNHLSESIGLVFFKQLISFEQKNVWYRMFYN